MNKMILEAQGLYKLGWAVHWIKPHSKAPVKAGWNGPKRDSWEILAREFVEGYGLGVRLGEASKVKGGYLANIDIDIKSKDPRHVSEAKAFVEKHYPGLMAEAPTVVTGYGLRLFCVTKEPLQSARLGSSTEECAVLMPTAPINKRQQAAVTEGWITAKELAEGWRMRPAWEVELMSAGKQVVLPPTIHPDTGREYKWLDPNKSLGTLPLISGDAVMGTVRDLVPRKVGGKDSGKRFVPVDVALWETRLPEHIVDMIYGEGVTDRSAALYTVIRAMVKSGFQDDEILTLLTDRELVLGETAYDHRNTQDRANAAAWLRDNGLAKARVGVSARHVFEAEVVEGEPLDEGGAAQQVGELTEWVPSRAGKHGDGGIQKTLQNTIGALVASFGPGAFLENTFADRTVFGVGMPWGAKAGDEFSDRDRVLLTEWFASEWGFEPPANLVHDGVAAIAARNQFNPVQDYLNGLDWDGEPRLSTWLQTYMSANDAGERYLAEVSRKVLIGMVARAFKPGCQFDYMLVLRGTQGLRKSSALIALAGGEQYYTAAVLRAGEKDTIAKMLSKWVVEFGEFSTAKADIDMLKHFITTRVDRDRLPFQHFSRDFPRRCIFVGTSNKEEIVSDETGDRRFWIVTVGKIDLEGLRRDRDQLFAEAKFFYDLGEIPALSDEAEVEARIEQERWRPSEDVIVDEVRAWLKKNKDGMLVDNKFPVDGFSLYELMNGGPWRNDMQTQKRVGRALRILGYKKKKIRKDGTGQSYIWVSG